MGSEIDGALDAALDILGHIAEAFIIHQTGEEEGDIAVLEFNRDRIYLIDILTGYSLNRRVQDYSLKFLSPDLIRGNDLYPLAGRADGDIPHLDREDEAVILEEHLFTTV